MITITGASGQLGQCVATALARRVSPSKVTLGTRNPERIGYLAAQGFKVVPADFDRPEMLEAAFAGAEVGFIICGDASNEIRIRQHRNAIDAAKRAGVGRVVYTSFVNPRRQSLFPYAAVHEDSEAYLKASGLAYTVLRNNHYAENLKNALLVAKRTGTLALLGARGKVAYIARADVAEATAGALTEAGHENKIYELTGEVALDLFEVGELASLAWGRKITIRAMDVPEFREVLTARGLPPYVVEAQIGIWLAAEAGEYNRVTDDAPRLAGAPIQSLADYLRQMA